MQTIAPLTEVPNERYQSSAEAARDGHIVFAFDAAAGRISGTITFAEGDEAVRDALVAALPKSSKVISTRCSTYYGRPGQDDYVGGIDVPIISFHARLAADGVNGGVNETGIRRFRSLVKALRAAGYEPVYRKSFSNSTPVEEVNALLA